MRKRLAALAAVAVLALAGCDSYNDSHGLGDAPAGKGDDSAAAITNNPDGFANLAVKCLKGDAPWAMAVTTSSGFKLFQDPARCGGKVLVGTLLVQDK